MNLCKCGCGLLVEKNYKRGHSRRGSHNSIEHNLALSKANKGKHHIAWNKGLKGVCKCSEERREKMKNIALQRGFGKWMIGTHPSKENIEKRRLKQIGHLVSIETRNKISKANSGEKNGCYGRVFSLEEKNVLALQMKKQWKNNKVGMMKNKVINCRKGALAASQKLKSMWYHNTKPELKMKVILDELGEEYKHSYPIWNIEHCYACDFYLPKHNIIIEVDGVYWHNWPYGTEKDHLRNKELREKGYKVARFREDMFSKNSVEHVLDIWKNITIKSGTVTC
jgi:hypothetical protein